MSLKSLIATGTKLWLDSIEPELVAKNRALGATGATSNPIIISDILKSGQHDDAMVAVMEGRDDATVAWTMTDKLVSDAQKVFAPVWEQTKGNNGYVSFELDPLLEDLKLAPKSIAERSKRYIELGKKWSAGHKNRMIKVPATAGGLGALEELAAAGIALNVTLIFSERQYKIARDAVWRGAQRRPGGLGLFKSVYSIFVSRVDVYTEKVVPSLSAAAQGLVGIVNAKRLWTLNQEFWKDKKTPLQQEIIFASTGTKKPTDPPDKYVEALAGSDIQTNPPATNDAVEKLGKSYTRQVDKMPAKSVLDEIDAKVDQQKMEEKLMEEGTAKFADPFNALLKLISEKRQNLAGALMAMLRLSAAIRDDVRRGIAAARQFGFAGVQLDTSALPELSASGRREIRALLRTSELQLIGLRSELPATGPVDAALARCESAIELAEGLGAPMLCVDVGLFLKTQGALGELAGLADRHGIAVPVRAELSGFTEIQTALAEVACPWFGLDLDPVAMLRDAWPPEKLFDEMGSLIRHIRARDAILGTEKRTKSVPIGQGSVNWKKLLALLDDAGYAGWMTLDSPAGIEFFTSLSA